MGKAATRKMRLAVGEIVKYAWCSDDVFEDGEPLKLRMRGEKFSAVEMRPCSRLAGLLGLAANRDRDGWVRIELWDREDYEPWPEARLGQIAIPVKLDMVFHTVLVHYVKYHTGRHVKVGGTLSEIIRRECRCDRHTEYLLVLSVPEDE